MINKLQALRDNSSNEDGFTLIELMIVVVIIGILAAIAIPIFMNQQKGAIGAGLKSDVKNTNTDLVTALVSNPTAADVSSLVTPTVSDDGTVVAVSGSWDNYTVRATNPNGSPDCYEFVSATGKYRECEYTPGGSDDEESSIVFGEVVWTGTQNSRTIYLNNIDGNPLGNSLCIPSLTIEIDINGVVRAAHSAPITLCDFNNSTAFVENATGTMGVRVAYAAATPGEHFMTFDVEDGQIVGYANVPANFVQVAQEGNTGSHSDLYLPSVVTYTGNGHQS